MLDLRPICENCAIDLPPASTQARICSYEFTFCRDCVDGILENVCPNCGGGFVPRPIRPVQAWRKGVSLADQAPAQERKHRPVGRDEQCALIARVGAIAPENR
ncbi:MAG: DUF1272 domain-containing protein [Proteobacteria bacterium]|nr:DUF1272 domain-containing protein [Pseudomonadota bacterium]MDA1355328.1 DUF1272 domain-containing protein [Pseudomonadota bacterium]